MKSTIFNKMRKFSNLIRVMETRDHFKNGASSKSLMSRMICNRVAITAFVLLLALSVSAQRRTPSWIATEGIPDMEITFDKGLIKQDGKLLLPAQVREAMVRNNDARQQYNSGLTLRTIGSIVMIPSAIPAGLGLGFLIGAYAAGAVNDENRAGIHAGCGILVGIGAVGITTGFVLASSGEKKIKNSILLHNSSLKRNVSYKVNFGVTQSGGLGLSLRF